MREITGGIIGLCALAAIVLLAASPKLSEYAGSPSWTAPHQMLKGESQKSDEWLGTGQWSNGKLSLQVCATWALVS